MNPGVEGTLEKETHIQGSLKRTYYSDITLMSIQRQKEKEEANSASSLLHVVHENCRELACWVVLVCSHSDMQTEVVSLPPSRHWDAFVAICQLRRKWLKK